MCVCLCVCIYMCVRVVINVYLYIDLLKKHFTPIFLNIAHELIKKYLLKLLKKSLNSKVSRNEVLPEYRNILYVCIIILFCNTNSRSTRSSSLLRLW